MTRTNCISANIDESPRNEGCHRCGIHACRRMVPEICRRWTRVSRLVGDTREVEASDRDRHREGEHSRDRKGPSITHREADKADRSDQHRGDEKPDAKSGMCIAKGAKTFHDPWPPTSARSSMPLAQERVLSSDGICELPRAKFQGFRRWAALGVLLFAAYEAASQDSGWGEPARGHWAPLNVPEGASTVEGTWCRLFSSANVTAFQLGLTELVARGGDVRAAFKDGDRYVAIVCGRAESK